FYICDPSGSTPAESRLIVLKVDVYPNKPAAVKDSATVDLYGVTEAQEKGPFAIPLVSTPSEQQGAIFTDKDAGASLTSYAVSVYTYVHKTDDSVGLYSNLSDVITDKQLVAQYDPATKTTETFFKTNAADGTPDTSYSAWIIEPWLGAITFSEDGSTMYIVPKKSTRGLHYISGSDSAAGISLYVKIEKAVNRANGTNYAPGSSVNPGYEANARMDVRISNSAPIMVGSTANNLGELANDKGVKVENRAYLWLEGTNGDSWTYYLNNELSQKDEALFRDPDGDAVTVKSVEMARVYTLDADGKVDNDFTNNATVRASASTAYATATTTKAYTLNAGKPDEVTQTYNALRISVQHKVDLPDSVADKNRTVYIDLRVTGQDTSNVTDSTVITLGIRNSVPVFRSEDDEAVKKYNTLHSSYSYDEGTGNAALTLVLNKDDYSPAQFLSTNGVVRVPLTDLIFDAD
ncbi:MAG: hypothetical protein K2L51_07080, partial [Clostridiales bacterium]|nr:hypothetical protein [Clostridiales bacterium]